MRWFRSVAMSWKLRRILDLILVGSPVFPWIRAAAAASFSGHAQSAAGRSITVDQDSICGKFAGSTIVSIQIQRSGVDEVGALLRSTLYSAPDWDSFMHGWEWIVQTGEDSLANYPFLVHLRDPSKAGRFCWTTRHATWSVCKRRNEKERQIESLEIDVYFEDKSAFLI